MISVAWNCSEKCAHWSIKGYFLSANAPIRVPLPTKRSKTLFFSTVKSRYRLPESVLPECSWFVSIYRLMPRQSYQSVRISRGLGEKIKNQQYDSGRSRIRDEFVCIARLLRPRVVNYGNFEYYDVLCSMYCVSLCYGGKTDARTKKKTTNRR
jgi:hypothetical protein